MKFASFVASFLLALGGMATAQTTTPTEEQLSVINSGFSSLLNGMSSLPTPVQVSLADAISSAGFGDDIDDEDYGYLASATSGIPASILTVNPTAKTWSTWPTSPSPAASSVLESWFSSLRKTEYNIMTKALGYTGGPLPPVSSPTPTGTTGGMGNSTGGMGNMTHTGNMTGTGTMSGDNTMTMTSSMMGSGSESGTGGSATKSPSATGSDATGLVVGWAIGLVAGAAGVIALLL
ncbi:MAG: hypothetical protein M1820_009310 [Bogoriella megaspora]|nr:MAG: hypothetical protein M1820_009310 [Bogoriella megaspora]